MASTVVTPLAADEVYSSSARAKCISIAEAWLGVGATAAVATWGDYHTLINPVLTGEALTTISNGITGQQWMDRMNALNALGSLSSFMASQSDGLWYDFSKTDELFQQDIGPTPASAANDVIGLAISQRTWNGKTLAQVVSSQPALTTDAGWTLGAGATRVGGEFTQTAGGGGYTYQLFSTGGAGHLIRVAFRVISGIYFCGVWTTPPTTGALGAVASYSAASHFRFVQADDADATFSFIADTGTAIKIDSVVVQDISTRPAIQGTTGFKPKYQTTGAVFDASDDNLLTSYVAQNGANFIVAYLDVPASIPATQVVAGASGSSANRCFLAFNTSGQLCAGVGSDSTTTIVGTTDWRGQTAVVGLSFDGATVKLFAGTAEEYSAAQAGTPTTTIPFRIGALNNNGTAGSFCGHNIKALLVGREALTLAQFKTRRTQLLAGN